jgi:hypothetical protein
MKRYLLANTVLQSLIITFILSLTVVSVSAQSTPEQQEAYKKVIHERVTKIVNTLDIADGSTFDQVVTIISNQYYSINSIHENSKTAVAAIKTQSLSTEERDALIKKEESSRLAILQKGHEAFINALKNKLSAEQLEKVKDGMTYRILPVTYEAYLDMLPRLTGEQKQKIYTWLQEARELAMDAESSDKKHQVFGKYKGKINNYLSAAGFDMKKEGEEWQKRIKERKATGQ